jgi:anti-sigma factor RsiW
MSLDCATATLLLQADHDGELDAGRAAELAAHLAGCPACRRTQATLRTLTARIRAEAPRYAAPPLLCDRVRRPAIVPRRAIAGGAAGFALAACLAIALIRISPPGLADAALAAHIRALEPGHLMDVVSTDRHTVKPWFAGKLDYAPPVADYAAEGFPLVGGRLDYLDGRQVAALVYKKRGHAIDVFVWPGSVRRASWSAKGYNQRSWTENGMAYLAVSDLNEAELDSFVDLLRNK